MRKLLASALLLAALFASHAGAKVITPITGGGDACPSPNFANHTEFTAGSFPFSLVSADFNGDGKPDLAIGHLGANNVSVLASDGAGGFAAPDNFVAAGGTQYSLASADFNRDGKPDLVGAGGGGPLSVMLNNSTGGFSSTFVDAGPLPYFVTVGDFNLDGKLDLAAVNLSPGSVSVLLGNGVGGFGARTSFPVGMSPEYAAVGDFNGDGKPDLAISNMNSNNVSILMGNGAGGFSAASNFVVGANPQGILVGDFNGDGKGDVVVANSGSNTVSLLQGNGAGSFAAAANFATGERPTFVVAADFNKDGHLDLAVADFGQEGSSSGAVSILFGTGGGFAAPVNFLVGRNPPALAAGDFNGDGQIDLAAVNKNTANVSVLLNGCASSAPAQMQFSASSYSNKEGFGGIRVTVTRAGDTAAAAAVSYATVDNLAAVRCDDTTTLPGVAFARCDYATSIDTLAFAPGETEKTFDVPVIGDVHVEGNETFQVRLFNPVGTTLGVQATATLIIEDDDFGTQPNPITRGDQFGIDFFVRMQYLDFLSREPEPGQPWSALLNNCPPGDTTCDRIKVSSAFFGSDEFKLKGFFVFNFYKVSFGRLPHYAEIIPDMRSVTGVSTEELRAKKAAFTDAWVQRAEFRNRYDSLANAVFVNALLDRYGVASITTPDPTSPDGSVRIALTRADLASRLDVGTLTRARALRAVADSDEVARAEFNSAFVAMQYFGYLRRDPEEGGYNDWLRTINANPADVRSMVNGFMNSTEYRLRFGMP